MSGKLVQECVSRRMVRLACVAQDARYAGKDDEHVQVTVHGGAVQMPRSQNLGPYHLPEAVPSLVREGCVRQNAHAVNDAREWRQCGVDALKHGVHRLCVRHVSEFNLHRHALTLQRGNGFYRFGIRVAASVQHDCARPTLCQPSGEYAANAA